MRNLAVIIVYFCFSFLSNGQDKQVVWSFDQSDYNYNQKEFKPRSSLNGAYIPNIVAKTSLSPGLDFQPDRFGNRAKAYKMTNDESIFFPSKFYGGTPVFGSANNVDEITISVWINFTNKTGNERIIFGAAEDAASPIKFGISLRNTTLYLKQFYGKENGSVGVKWDYECFKPGAFDAGFGWYHLTVIYAKTQKYMRVLVGKPNGGAEYGPGTDTNVPGNNKVKREFDGRLIWIPGIRDKLKDFNHWSLQTSNGLIFDDMIVYNRALTLDEVRNNFYDQKSGSARKSGNTEKTEIVFESKKTEDILVYPNPTDGMVTIKLKSNTPDGTKIKLSLMSLLGTRLWSTTVNAKSNKIEQDLRNSLNLTAGVYIITIEGNNFYEKREIYIK